MGSELDKTAEAKLLNQILEHRLEQDDIKRLLGALSSRDREEFLGKLADILGKMNALLDVSNRLADSLSLDVLFQRLVEITTEAVRADRGTIFLNDTKTDELFARVAMGEQAKEIRFPNHLGIAGTVFTTGEPIIIHDAYADPRFNQAVDKQTGYRTRNIVTAPIKNKKRQRVGVLQLLNKHDGDFTDDDLALLEALASQASAALQNAQLFEAVEKARAEESQLLEVTKAISSELNLGPLLQKIMATVTAILEADRSTLFLIDKKTNELWSRVAQGMQESEIRFPSHLGIAGTVFTNGQSINIPDAYADARFNQSVDKKTGYKTDTILCCPVVNKNGESIGVTQVLNKRDGPFKQIDEDRLMAFSAQAAIAIENAQLFEDVLNMKNYAESMLQSMSNGVLTLSVEGRVERCNAAATRILAADEELLLGSHVAELFERDNAWVVDAVEKVTGTGEADLAVDVELRRADDELTSVNLNAVPLVSSHKVSLGTMLVFEDISGEKRLKSTLARYMTKEVADQLLAGGEEVLGGLEREATVLFSDIRSFTTISEELGPTSTVTMLNEYFSIMVDILFEYDGILDKYIGDAIMAVFGTPFPTPQDADNAVGAAVEMMRALAELNRTREADGQSPLDIGIGVNTNPVVAGNIGSLRRMDYTVIGDGVNLAARLEGACKVYRSNILISEFTREMLQRDYAMREVDLLRVKGKTRPVAVYEVLDFHSPESFPHREEIIALTAEGIAAYRVARWSEAMACFEKIQGLHSADGTAAVYLERCRYFLDNPPEPPWDGVWTLTSK